MRTTSPQSLAAAYPRTLRLNREFGWLEKRCPGCATWWPADAEFFTKAPAKPPLGLHSYCNACTAERTRRRRSKVSA